MARAWGSDSFSRSPRVPSRAFVGGMTRRDCLGLMVAGGSVAGAGLARAEEVPPTLTAEQASHFARLALAGVTKEYPNKLDHVMNGPDEVKSPRALHPAFYGCFDWHSAVHGHWLLARVRRAFPGLPERAEIDAALGANLTDAAVAAELAYLRQPSRGSFERTYGWAWLLKLQEELLRGDAAARAWATVLSPLAREFGGRYVSFLPKQDYPIRSGTHPNTAFGLSFAHDWATLAGDATLRDLVAERGRAYFAVDADYPARFEPGGEDFFSPALMEADLMRRLLGREAFAAWWRQFLPRAAQGEPAALFQPAKVSDRADLKIVHLDGLNLSRAWCLRHIADALPPEDASVPVLRKRAAAHADASLPHVSSGNYAGEHWLATFALLMLAD